MSDSVSPTPPAGSLGLLALGWRGIVAWRSSRGVEWREDLRRTHATVGPVPTREPASDALAAVSLVVVTGLPRSGTSMMMQMLVAGGVPAFTDHARQSDASNPRGYLEHSRVLSLARDRTWIPEADGHAVKVVAPLLPFLPPGPAYHVISMTRPLAEVLASQAAMLTRLGGAEADADRLGPAFERRLAAAQAWMAETPRTAVLEVGYAEALDDPAGVARLVAQFLGAELDPAAMACAVDPTLRRHRA